MYLWAILFWPRFNGTYGFIRGLDKTRIATRLRNCSDGTAAGGYVRLSNDSAGFRKLSDTGRTESEEENVCQKRTDW